MLAKELISCTVLSGYNIQKDIENARFHSAFFTYEESMINDGLIHLLANGDISFCLFMQLYLLFHSVLPFLLYI